MTITYFRKMAFPDADDAFATSMGRSTVAAICELVQSDRRREPYDAGLLRGCLRMLHVLNVYVKRFEPVFLQESEPYFSEFAESHSTSSLKEYINACKGLLGREEFRCLEFVMELTTQRQLMQSAHHFLIVKYTSKLLDADNLSKLLESVDIVSVSNLYDLLRLSNIHEELRQPWGDYIRGAVARIIGDRERGDEMVIRLLELRRALDLLLRDALMDDDRLLYAMREAFSSVMNDRQAARCWNNGKDKIGEMIAKYMDMLLRGGLKALPASLLTNSRDRPVLGREDQDGMGNDDAELDLQLDHALEMFRFVEGKDTFENFYKRDLARRLLMGRSASQDAERSMLAKLRSECGSNFTHNLEQMFKDQELAKDEMQAYREWNAGAGRSSAPRNGSPTVDLQVMILSAASWPTYPDVQLNLPDGVAAETERFDAFYKNKHTGRVLSWKHSLAHCSLKAKFAKGTKELLVSAYQAVVLLLFNSVPAPGSADDAEAFLTYDQIAKATGLGGTDLDRTLQSLACGKSRVLSKHPKGRDINRETDTFSFNKAFTDPKFRIKINQIQHKETKEENKATHERIAQDRRFETQAAIVRIMKSRKKMSHPELQAEVINMTKSRGSVEPAAIKKEIER